MYKLCSEPISNACQTPNHCMTKCNLNISKASVCTKVIFAYVFNHFYDCTREKKVLFKKQLSRRDHNYRRLQEKREQTRGDRSLLDWDICILLQFTWNSSMVWKICKMRQHQHWLFWKHEICTVTFTPSLARDSKCRVSWGRDRGEWGKKNTSDLFLFIQCDLGKQFQNCFLYAIKGNRQTEFSTCAVQCCYNVYTMVTRSKKIIHFHKSSHLIFMMRVFDTLKYMGWETNILLLAASGNEAMGGYYL